MMRTAFLLAICLATSAVADDVRSGAAVGYRGAIRPRGDGDEARPAEKQFDLTLLVAAVGDDTAELYWLVDETGRGSWPWIERFGRLTANLHGREADERGPSLLYEHDAGTTVVPLSIPLLRPPVQTAPDASWSVDRLAYTLTAAEEVDGQPVWNVLVHHPYGLKRRLTLDGAGPVVRGFTERVFVGMGNEYELSARLIGVEQIDTERFEAERAAFDALIELRARLERAPRTEHAEWSESQLALLAERLPAVIEQAATTRLKKISEAAERDVERQTNRAADVSKLVGGMVGKQVDDFKVDGLDRRRAYAQDLKGKPLLLHFWEYRDAPLDEPYGQVGYLEFLQERYQDDGLIVLGVAVDGRLNDGQTRGEAIRSVRRLKQFMNLSYPIALDGGALIEQFGDPRKAGAALPLYVLVDAEGRIVEYHVGFYEVDREAGLKQLDAAVRRLVSETP